VRTRYPTLTLPASTAIPLPGGVDDSIFHPVMGADGLGPRPNNHTLSINPGGPIITNTTPASAAGTPRDVRWQEVWDHITTGAARATTDAKTTSKSDYHAPEPLILARHKSELRPENDDTMPEHLDSSGLIASLRHLHTVRKVPITAAPTPSAGLTSRFLPIIPIPGNLNGTGCQTVIPPQQSFGALSSATCTDYDVWVTSTRFVPCGGCQLTSLQFGPGPVSASPDAA
jgi:hypothetical protein